MAKKKNKSKISVSVTKSKKQQQKKGQQQQSQSLNVNVNLGKKGGRKTTPKPPNYPPFFNQYNPSNNWSIPPPIPPKQYLVFPEGETAPILGILSTVPVPLRIGGNPLKEKTKEPTLKVAPIDENIFKPAPAEDNLFVAQLDIEPTPQFVTSLDEPATEIIGDIPLTAEEERQREEELSRLAEEEKQKRAIETFKKVRKGQKVKEEERLKKETMTGIITGQAPQIEQTKPKRGRPLGSTNKPKETFDPNQSALGFSQQVVTAEAIPAEITAQGVFNLYAPLGEQPSAQLQEKITFLGQPAAQPAAEESAKVETLQRQRRVIERATPEATTRFIS